MSSPNIFKNRERTRRIADRNFWQYTVNNTNEVTLQVVMANYNPDPKHQWQPGQTGNPNGRPTGSRNKRTTEVLELIRAAGYQDPLVTLAKLQAESADEGIQATAANMLAPYLHSKLAAKPQPRDPQYIEEAINLPRPNTIRQAYENIALLTEYKSQAKLDLVTADSLIS